jgi:large subunit ribosomal protein L15
MKISSLESVKTKKLKSKRVGRGESSGKGKTAGRGMKGQKARYKIKPAFEGGQLPIIKRLPFQRGVGNKHTKRVATITLGQLNRFKSGSRVDLELLRENNFLPKSKNVLVKVVATGKVEKPLVVKLPATERATKLIEKAKGKVEKNV